MKEFRESKIEEKEEPFEADLRVDFIRHGKPRYAQKEIESGRFEGELTLEGRDRVKQSALELIRGIDRDKELIVIWTSPRERAEQTSKVIRDVFNEAKIPVVEKGWKRKRKELGEGQVRTQETLRDVGLTGEFVDELKKKAVTDWMDYWVKAKELPMGTEGPKEVKRRTERLIAHLERIARIAEPPKGKKLHFICVGHEETVRDLLEKARGCGAKGGVGLNYGEVVRMDIHKSEPGRNAVLNLGFGGLEAELNFDKEKRKIF